MPLLLRCRCRCRCPCCCHCRCRCLPLPATALAADLLPLPPQEPMLPLSQLRQMAQPNLQPRDLGCAFRYYFSVWRDLIFWNPQDSVNYFRFRRRHVGIQSLGQDKFVSESARIRNPAGILSKGPLKVLHPMPRVTNIQLAD
jgi:hypothetical protein